MTTAPRTDLGPFECSADSHCSDECLRCNGTGMLRCQVAVDCRHVAIAWGEPGELMCLEHAVACADDTDEEERKAA